VDHEPEFYHPTEWRGRSDDKKQGSEGVVELFEDHSMRQAYNPTEMNNFSLETYEYLLGSGVAPEQARMVLPQSMMTEWYWSGSLDAFSDMCNLRCKPDTQAETAEVAWDIDRMMIKLFPVSWKALRENQ
jgi:thymidylate synthase (FAD)